MRSFLLGALISLATFTSAPAAEQLPTWFHPWHIYMKVVVITEPYAGKETIVKYSQDYQTKEACQAGLVEVSHKMVIRVKGISVIPKRAICEVEGWRT